METELHSISYGSGPTKRSLTAISRFLRNVTVEPVVFLYALGFSLTIVVSPNLYYDKICSVSYPF